MSDVRQAMHHEGGSGLSLSSLALVVVVHESRGRTIRIGEIHDECNIWKRLSILP